MTDLVANFQKLVSGLTSSESQESDLLLLQLDEITGKRVRLCAIPHSFDAQILQVLDQTLDQANADAVMADLGHLAAVVQLPGCLALHDVVRRQFFLQWLRPENRSEFTAVSRRLAQFFQPGEQDTAAQRSKKENSFVYHLIGADQEEGFKHFRLLYGDYRSQLQTSNCEVLVRLLAEYEPVLSDRLKHWLTYFQAEVAADAHDWACSDQLLDGLLQLSLDPDLRAAARLRRGSVLREIRRYDEAQTSCNEALRLSEAIPNDAPPLHLIHYELGLIARDRGNITNARTHLDESLRLAKAAHNRVDIAAVTNSLATLLLMVSPEKAIGILDESLKLLDPDRDAVRVAPILNNLAIAHANNRNWQQSETYYQRSLSIKRAAADSRGEAMTLLNIARVYRSLGNEPQTLKSLSDAGVLFETLNEPANAALAYRELARIAGPSEPRENVEALVHKAVDLFASAGNRIESNATRREFRRLLNRTARRPPWLVLTVIVTIFVLLLLLVFIVKSVT